MGSTHPSPPAGSSFDCLPPPSPEPTHRSRGVSQLFGGRAPASASTQTQALNALVFLYDSVLQMPLGKLAGLKRVQRRQRVPVVLTREEVKSILEHMTGVLRLMAELLYGAGLRVGECVTLRPVAAIRRADSVLPGRSPKDLGFVNLTSVKHAAKISYIEK